MATRIFLRKNGSSEPGCMAKLPATWAELLAVADTKLYRQPGSGNAKRVFAAAGDEILDDDYDLIESNDTLYVSLGEDWRAPAAGVPPLNATTPPQEQPMAAQLAQVPADGSTAATPSAAAVAASSPAVKPASASAEGPASPAAGGGAPAAAASPAASPSGSSPSGAAGASPSGAGAMDAEGAAEAKEDDGAEAGDEMEEDLYQVEQILALSLTRSLGLSLAFSPSHSA